MFTPLISKEMQMEKKKKTVRGSLLIHQILRSWKMQVMSKFSTEVFSKSINVIVVFLEIL